MMWNRFWYWTRNGVCQVLLMVGLMRGVCAAPAQDDTELMLSGTSLSAAEATSLEKQVQAKPEDWESRLKLLGYYFTRQHDSKKIKEARAKHVLWVIANRPECNAAGTPNCTFDPGTDSESYAQAKSLWQDHVAKNPTNTAMLSHAASYFTLNDRDLAENYLKKLEELEPNNAEWHRRLSHLYELESRFPKAGVSASDAAVKALQQKESAYALSKRDAEKFYLLTDLGQLAFRAGQPQKAVTYAQDTLKMAERYKTDWNYGNAIYSAHTALGLVALSQGNKQEARTHLIESANHKGSPQLNSFGPDMELAKAMMQAGEKDAVQAYLKLCKRFWEMGQKSLDAWIAEIQSTGKTDFKARY